MPNGDERQSAITMPESPLNECMPAHGIRRICICATSHFHPDHRARMPITAALMIISVAKAMLALNGRPLTCSSSAVDANGVM